MAKNKYSIDETKIARFIKEGRGKGEGKFYKPWLTVQDVPSSGRSLRTHSFKTGREHHLLSDMETGAFFLYNWIDEVTDIWEQFPLDRSVTQQIARDMGVKHPTDPTTQCPIVMTTDLVMKTTHGSRLARSIKSSDAFDSRTLDKLEIERRYWEQEKEDWGLITELQLPKMRIQNIRWGHEFHSLDGLNAPYAEYWNDRCIAVTKYLSQSSNVTIRTMLDDLEARSDFRPDDALNVLRHLISNKVIDFDMDIEWLTTRDISCLKLSGKLLAKERRNVA